MKNLQFKLLTLFLAFLLIGVESCKDESVKPVLADASKFIAQSITNSATTTAGVVLTPQNVNDVFEVFEWSKANFGANVSTDYTLEISNDDTFTNVKVLGTSSSTKLSVTKGKFNEAMLALGLPAFSESTVKIRVKSSINGRTMTPLVSQIITRKATTFQNSECGTFCTVGIIGDATPGGWDIDTDLFLADPTRKDKDTWTAIVYLIGGKDAKFRASDNWDKNWGADAFPTGTGTQNGSNIRVSTTGFYKVTLNSSTGAYSFVAQSVPTLTSVSIIGDGTPGGWDADTPLTQDATNPNLWTATITFTAKEAKFRKTGDWGTNWGSKSFPSGVGVGNGDNIKLKAGTFFVRFNSATGEYAFGPVETKAVYTKVGLIGPAQSGGWDADTFLTRNPSNPTLFSGVVTLTDNDVKFRANADWGINWGAAATPFPGGVGSLNGSNIPAKAGKYYVTINTVSGEYYFLK